MATLFDSASLVMVPSGVKDDKLYSIKPTNGDGDFTFSRDGSGASVATRVNSAGLIEKGRTNLLLQSNSFNTTWTNSGTITRTSGQSGYDGTNDAWLLTKGTAGAFIRQTISQSGVRTFSVYAKADTADWMLLVIDGSPDDFQYFDLANGVLGASGTNLDATITSVGNGWYRCSVTGTNNTYLQVRIYPAEGNNDVTGTTTQLYIQDSQLEKGLVATSVIETTTAAASAGILGDMPRLDYSGGASCPSLLLEPARTNLITNSEYIGATEWVNASATRDITITQTSETNPEGSAICWKIQGTATNNQLAYVGSTTSGTTLTNSIYVKRVSGTGDVILRDVNNSSNTFSLSVSDGWKRIYATATATSNTARFYLNLDDFSDEILVWGAQQEAGSYPSSYVPTYGSSTARAKDVCDGAGDSSVFNDSEGVLFAEVSFARDKGKSSPFKVERISLSDGTSNNRVFISNTTNLNALQVFVRNASGISFNRTITLTDITANNKIALKYKANDFALWVNGTEESTDTSSSNVPSGLNELMFDGPSGNYEFEGNVKQLLVFNTALTDAELASLTSL